MAREVSAAPCAVRLRAPRHAGSRAPALLLTQGAIVLFSARSGLLFDQSFMFGMLALVMCLRRRRASRAWSLARADSSAGALCIVDQKQELDRCGGAIVVRRGVAFALALVPLCLQALVENGPPTTRMGRREWATLQTPNDPHLQRVPTPCRSWCLCMRGLYHTPSAPVLHAWLASRGEGVVMMDASTKGANTSSTAYDNMQDTVICKIL